MANSTHSESRVDDRLSQLIRLKRQERPDQAFWATFEQGVRSRQLASLVTPHPWHTRVRRALILAARKAAPPAAALSALAFAFVVANKSQLFSSKSAEDNAGNLGGAAPASDVPLFVVQPERNPSSQPGDFEAADQSAPTPPAMARPVGPYQLMHAPSVLATSPARADAEASAPPYGAKVIPSERQF